MYIYIFFNCLFNYKKGDDILLEQSSPCSNKFLAYMESKQMAISRKGLVHVT